MTKMSAMKLKLDENLPSRLVDELSNLGHDVDTVPKGGSIITGIASFTPIEGFQKIKKGLRSQAEVVLVVGFVDSGKIYNSEDCVAQNGCASSRLTLVYLKKHNKSL
jgi:hypothetical protein